MIKFNRFMTINTGFHAWLSVVADFYFGGSIPSKAALHNGVVYFAPQAIAKLAPSRIHPKGSEIKVPDNFSRGWAIKLSERDRIILYKWDCSFC